MYLEPTARDSPSPNYSETEQPFPKDKAAIKAELERLSTVAVAMIHTQRFDHPALQCWADTLKTSHDGVEIELGRREMYAQIEATADRFPGQFSEVVIASADVDERRGRAKVYLTTMVRGLPGNLSKEGVAMLCWERRKDAWICWKHVGLGGVAGFT